MASKIKAPPPWVEIHMRNAAATPLTFADVRCEDYTHRGGQIPWQELSCVSDVYGMFRPVPVGFEQWFDRPVGPYDMLVLCRPVTRQRVVTHPLMAVPVEVQDAFLGPDSAVVVPKCWMSGERVAATHHQVIIVGCNNPWRSHSKLK